jgi:hypothetical protein
MTAQLPMAATESQLLGPSDLVHLRRAEQLLSAGATELAAYELAEIPARDTMPNDFLVYMSLLNHRVGNHLTVFRIFTELSRRGYMGLFSPYGQKLLFPDTLLKEIKKIAKKNNVEPYLAVGVVKQESAFNAAAVSAANAFGLMQIIRPTAKDLDPRVEVADLFQSEKNIELGTRYLNQLLVRFKSNVILVLAGYNAGPGNADRWNRDAPSNLPPEEFIELITYRETREYVQNILRNYFWYQRIYEGRNYNNISELVHSASGLSGRGPTSISTIKSAPAYRRTSSSKR